MSKVRIYDLARELGIQAKDLYERIRKMGYDVKSHSSTLSEEEAAAVRQELAFIKNSVKTEEKKEAPAPKKVVVRRHREEPKEETEKAEEATETAEAQQKKKLKIKLVIKKPPKKEEPEKEVAETPKEEPQKATPEEFVAKETKPEEPTEEISAEKLPPEEARSQEAKKEISEERPKVRGPKVVARTVGVVKREVIEPKKAKPERPSKPERPAKPKKGRRVVTEFERRPKKEAAAPPPEPQKEPEKKKKKRKKHVVELDEFRKKAKKKAAGARPKSEREEILEELELMRELEAPTEELLAKEEELARATEKEKAAKKEEKKEPERPPTAPPKEKKIKVYESIQVGELAKAMGVKASDIIKKFMELGTMVTINQSIDPETAAIVAAEFGYEVEQAAIEEEQLLEYTPPSPDELKPRPPVVTVMGHVDHGKTTLLDAIRETDVVSREAGGITQHIGAYKVKLKNGQEITFIDTPGHEAFTHMRARGAQVTDIVILVVAADDGVMDQTKEAIDHARAAGVPIVVAINKIDKPEANPERVKSELAELGLVPEDWGGDTLYAEISAKKKIGIDDLLELVLLQAEMLELKAAPDRPARGRIVESRLDKGRGPVATVIIQEGTLKEGDPFVAGITYGRVRAMLDERGRRLKEAGPASPVEILGFHEVPQAGDDFIVMPDEQKARKVAEYRARKQREAEAAKETKMSLEKLFEKLKEGEIKELKVVLKADVQGTLEALQDSLQKLATDEVRVNIIRSGIGAITESDIMLASASDAIVIGFNVRPTSQAKRLAEQEKVEIRFYDVIYKLIEDVKKAMSGLLEPEIEERIMGVAEVRATFKVPKVGTVAGCYVKEGKLERGAKVRLLRDNVVIYTGKIASLKRFKEDVKEVVAGYECGVGLENFNDIKVGDLIEAFELVEIKREL
ncbi:translation initiation factor IF-2 [Thermodesulfatator indicus DSM 15286]|uniref:Translation initiation factor IF-2 n=1 Tax=Thermodesulfatator indicus (strain DSM 15286 / JCM 11887 / CIR29812) TaxID=667014 RepID=F8A9F5_THEID|nr:translation initiation factor IF-2 [Thermodesulfatator indicus]AEH44096.1 translation initiation factor IF-2 [Thermodesulfatator indicus DSM 15286]